MEDSNPIEIQLSKSKLILMALGSLIFVLLGIALIVNPSKYESFIIRSPTFIFIAGVLSVLFFGFMELFFLKKLQDRLPGLIISEEGIMDNSAGFSAGFIPWSDIINIKEVKIVNQKYIKIIVKNPQVYISRQKSAFKRKAMQVNYNTWRTAIEITVNGLKINYNDLKTILEKSFNDFKSQNI